ncbi:10907_t:CDS:10 [Diversispora eburnea]|uniref:Mediator of RNA polymerase II transcription subunit 14 n=1 Tax=Diversispora eburnea TaxID=1213867 RepID=A0A9N8V1Q2_9GLOM|nr:10907_t:CDS:10 [Diversispora eburnea]
MENPEIKKSHASRPQEWKSLQDVVASVNCESRDKLVSFIHGKASLDTTEGDRRKPFMLNFLVPQRQQFLKLKSLVNWSENADVIPVQNQQLKINQVLYSLIDFNYGVIPKTSIRCPDITTSIDVLTTGRYQKFPKIIEETLAPKIVSDKEVKEALKKINTDIELRILTEEVLPPAMKNYHVADGRITFKVNKEFEVVLTPNVAEENVYWYILDLKFLIQSEHDKLSSDIDLFLHEYQIEHIKYTVQQLLYRPQPNQLLVQQSANNQMQGKESISTKIPKHLPLLKLYDYLHTLCLDTQLEILYYQAYRLHRTRWADNLVVNMDQTHTTLKVFYWSLIKHEQRQQSRRVPPSKPQQPINEDVLEITITEDIPKKSLIHSSRSKLMNSNRANWLSDTSKIKLGVLNDGKGLNCPRKFLQARWSGLTANNWIVLDWEFDPTKLNIEHVLLSITQQHADAVIRNLKKSLSVGFSEKDVEIIDGDQEFPEDFLNDESPISDKIAKKYLKIIKLRVWLTLTRWVDISVDIRSGRIVIEENQKCIDEDRIKMCEEKLSYASNSTTAAETIYMLKRIAMMDQIEKSASFLKFDIHHGVILRKDDYSRLGTTQLLFLRFPQYKNYFIICGMIEQGLRYWLVLLSREPPIDRPIFDRYVRDPTHRLLSIQLVNIEDLQLLNHNVSQINLEHFDLNNKINRELSDKNKMNRKESENVGLKERRRTSSISGKRNFNEVDNNTGEMDLPRKRKVTHLVAGARISYRKVEEQLRSRKLSFSPVQPKSSMEFLDSNTPISLNSSIPVWKLNKKQLLSRLPMAIDKTIYIFGELYLRYVGTRMIDSSVSSILISTCLKLNSLPTISNIVSINHIHYDPASQVISFNYKVDDSIIENFLNDWNNIVMICQAASQVNIQKWEANPMVKLVPFDFEKIKIYYSKEMFYEDHNFDVLISTLIYTAPLFSIIDELELNNKTLVGGYFLNVIPRSFKNIRLIYSPRITPFSESEKSPRYGIDVTIREDDHIDLTDASSRVTKLQSIPLWEKLSDSIGNNNDIKSIPLMRYVSLTVGYIIPINECQNIFKWLDNHIRNNV